MSAATPEAGFAAVAATLLREPDVAQGTGFGSNPGLRTGRRIFAMLVRDALVVKLPAERCAALVENDEAEVFAVGKRRMTEWVSVSGPDPERWLALAAEARAFVGR